MNLGIVGLSGVGKTTVFNALTHQDLPTGTYSPVGKVQVAVAAVDVPDPRVNDLITRYRPRKSAYATVTFADIGGLEEGIGAKGIAGPLRNELSKVDGLVHVVRAFARAGDGDGPPDPARDRATLEAELLLLDMLTVERRLERLEADRLKRRDYDRRANEDETALMRRLQAHLETERPLRWLRDDLTAGACKLIGGYGLFTLKPLLVLANVPDAAPWTDDAVIGIAPHTAEMSLHGLLEAEIARLEAAERASFLAEYGIGEPGVSRVLRAAYALIGLQSFFTVGEDEVRAWTVPVGATAQEAAAVIHTDLGRGFIRAEVTAYSDLTVLGDMKAVKAAGRQRLEGKDYLVQDGDILTIRSGL